MPLAGSVSADQLGTLDPKAGKITEIKFPLRYTEAYDTWPDKDDNIWISDSHYNVLVYYDRKTQKFTYYPLPQGSHWSVPKVEIDRDNTVWTGSRGVPNIVAVHFYPNGYTVTQKPRW